MASPSTKPKADPIADAILGVTAPTKQAETEQKPAEQSALDAPKATVEQTAAIAAATTAGTPEVKSTKRLSLNRMQLQGYLHNNWDVTAERGAELRDVLNPEYWLHVAAQLKPHDTITVISEDGTWYARLLVISADARWAKVFKLEHHDLTASYADMPKTQEEEYEITWNALSKYAVVKKSMRGQPPLKDGFQTKLEAYKWLDGHLKTLNS